MWDTTWYATRNHCKTLENLTDKLLLVEQLHGGIYVGKVSLIAKGPYRAI